MTGVIHEAAEYIDIEFYSILSHQVDEVEAEQRFKLLCQGRRRGKDREMLHAAIFGHGPADEHGEPLHGGIITGGDVAWLAPDFTQGKGIWDEEVLPRFGNLPEVCKVDRSEQLSLHIYGGQGTLFFRSYKNINSIRGLGSNLIGIIINEAAWFDLELAWRKVIRPILIDNRGWAIIASTPNSGRDGNQAHRVPSFFNILCDEVDKAQNGDAEMAKRRSPKVWRLFEGDARDNPVIHAEEFQELVNEYPAGSVALEEEVYAKRLPPGNRMRAIPQFSRRVHLIEPFPIPAHWPRFGAFDWGFQHYAVFGGFAVDEDGTLYLEDSLWMREMLPDKLARTIKGRWDPSRFAYIHAGHDVKAKHVARSDEDIPTIQEKFAEHEIELTLASIDREMGLAAMQDVFGWEERGPGGTAGDPRIYIMRTPGNMLVIEQVETILTDEKDPRKAEIRNADPRTGLGGDDGFTMLRYGIASRFENAPSLTAAPADDSAFDPATLAAESHRNARDARTMPELAEDVADASEYLGLVNPGL